MSTEDPVVVRALRGGQTDTASPPPTGNQPTSAAVRQTSHQLELALKNAEYLLSYAVEAGIEIDPDIPQRIIAARRQGEAIWDGPDAGALISAITKLAAKLHPVTAETLRACREESHGAIRGYKRIALWLASIIIPLSMISFFAWIKCGVLLRCVPTCTTRPCFRAAATIASPSSTSRLMGFCTYTSAPDSTAAVMTSECQ